MLDGIDGYSHLFLLTYLDRLRPEQVGPLKVRPRKMVQKGFALEELPWLGVFALDSPTRPNPIGLSLVELLGRDGPVLRDRGLDCFDGTPVLDVKAYQPGYRPEAFDLPEWYHRLVARRGPA